MSEDACIVLSRSPKNRSKRALGTDFEVRNLVAHAVAEVLSQNSATCLNVRGATCSNTSHPMTKAASSRSLIVMEWESKASLIVFGHSNVQMK